MKDPNKERATFSKQNYDAYSAEVEFLAPCVAGAIVEVLDPRSVVDLGAGLGIYLRELAALGVEVKGYEFSPDAIEFSEAAPGVVEYHDLTETLAVSRRYDLALCCQVAEHIDGEFAEHVVRLVTDLSDVVYWSAARPGAGGQHHVNEQWPPYWHEKFERRGYRQDEGLAERIRAGISKRCPRVGWGHHIYTDCVIYVNEIAAWEAASDEALMRIEERLEVIPHG